MNFRYLFLILLGLVLLAAAADLAWFYPRLPEQIATHFNGHGVADGWSSKAGFAVGQGCLLVGLSALFAGLAWLLPRTPVSLINLPHRDYWLAPARRAATMETASNFLLVMAVVITTFLTGLMHLLLAANLAPPARVGSAFGALMAAQLGTLLSLVIGLVWRFRRPKA